MFDWLWGGSSRKATPTPSQVSDALQSLEMKAAGTSATSLAMGTVDSIAGLPAANLGSIREQLRHFRGWPYVAIRAVASRIAGQELRVGRMAPAAPAGMMTKAADGIEAMPSHPLIDAIDDPNEFMVRWSLLFVTICQLELTGRAYWWFVENNGRLQIWPLPPDWVTPNNEGGIRSSWTIRPRGSTKEITVAGDDLAFFYLPDPADPTGAVSPLGSQAAAMNLDEAIQQAHAAAMNNSVKPGMVLTVGEQSSMMGGPPVTPMLTVEQRDQILTSIRQAYAGMTKYGSTIILDALIKDVKPFTTSAEDIEFKDGAKLAKSRIFQAFGVHEFIVGEAAPSSYAQAAAVERVFCDNVVNPLLELMSQTLTAWLGPKFGGPNGSRLKVWFEKCRALDDDLEFRKWTLAANKEYVTPDEFRAYLGLEPMAKPAADSKPATDPAPAGEVTAPTTDVQAAALNGAQIQSLLAIIAMVNDGSLPVDAARAVIAASFPLLPAGQVDAIVNALEPGKVADAAPPIDAVVKFLAKRLDPYSLTVSDGK